MKDLLIVEDGRIERERLQKLFSTAGYRVVVCESAAEAESVLAYENFRLAILDVGLADKSGSYLFNAIKRASRVNYIIIFTGNPSVHLKQRFLDEGAADYIVKGSTKANNENFLARIVELIGAAQAPTVSGIVLEEFLSRYVAESSKPLFLSIDDSYPACSGCGSEKYIVTFANQPQVPPQISGLVVCAACGKPMDPEVT